MRSWISTRISALPLAGAPRTRPPSPARCPGSERARSARHVVRDAPLQIDGLPDARQRAVPALLAERDLGQGRWARPVGSPTTPSREPGLTSRQSRLSQPSPGRPPERAQMGCPSQPGRAPNIARARRPEQLRHRSRVDPAREEATRSGRRCPASVSATLSPRFRGCAWRPRSQRSDLPSTHRTRLSRVPRRSPPRTTDRLPRRGRAAGTLDG